MAALDDIFNEGQAAVPMAAPGLPLQALSNNPQGMWAASMGMLGSNAGAALSRGIQGAFGVPMVDPMALAQQRQSAYIETYQRELERTGSRAEAIKNAANQVELAPNERLTALGIAATEAKEERKELDTLTSWVNKQDAVKNYKSTFESYQSIRRQLAKDNDPTAQALAFFEAMKLVDPGVAVTQGEVDFMRASASGNAFFPLLAAEGEGQIDLRYLATVINSGGKKGTLTPAQKKRFTQALQSIVEGRRQAALGVLDRGSAQWTAGGRPLKKFTDANAATFAQVDPTLYPILEDIPLEQFGKGTMVDDLAEFVKNPEELDQKAKRLLAGLMPAARVYGRVQGEARAASLAGSARGVTEGAGSAIVDIVNDAVSAISDFNSEFGVNDDDPIEVAETKIFSTVPDVAISRANRSNASLYEARKAAKWPNLTPELRDIREEVGGAPVAKDMLAESYRAHRQVIESDRQKFKGVHKRAKQIQNKLNISYAQARKMAEAERR